VLRCFESTYWNSIAVYVELFSALPRDNYNYSLYNNFNYHTNLQYYVIVMCIYFFTMNASLGFLLRGKTDLLPCTFSSSVCQ